MVHGDCGQERSEQPRTVIESAIPELGTADSWLAAVIREELRGELLLAFDRPSAAWLSTRTISPSGTERCALARAGDTEQAARRFEQSRARGGALRRRLRPDARLLPGNQHRDPVARRGPTARALALDAGFVFRTPMTSAKWMFLLVR
jgi:hypothetical protein